MASINITKENGNNGNVTKDTNLRSENASSSEWQGSDDFDMLIPITKVNFEIKSRS